MGIFSGIVSAGINLVASAVSGACSVCNRIGGAVAAGIASNFLSPLPKLFPALQVIVLVIQAVAKAAEILVDKPEVELPEEIAMRAEDAELQAEDFSSFDEYMEYLRSEIKSNPVKIEALTDEERRQYALVGTGMYVHQMEEKYGMTLDPRFWYAANRMDLGVEDTANLVKDMKQNQISSGGDLKEYMDGSLKSRASCASLYDALDQMVRQRNPAATDAERADIIDGLRESYQKKDG